MDDLSPLFSLPVHERGPGCNIQAVPEDNAEGASLELAQVTKERDLYRKLLDLGTGEALGPFLEEALALIVDVARARRGYIELGRSRDGSDRPRWWIATGFSEEQIDKEVRARLSRGVIAEAIARGTVFTDSALEDLRFKKRSSVKLNNIGAVICAPICAATPIGVVYLQDRVDEGRFSEEDRRRVEVFAHHLVPFVDRLLSREERRDEEDPTRVYRASLDVARLVGRSAALARVLDDVRLVASREVTVLLTGATGTGKTDLARVLHDNSRRRGRPFVALNCATLGTLAESELFGHEKGAFTGADRRAEGKVAAASGGTLFLDEVGELPLGAQAKLLKFLDTKEYYAVGASHLSRADVRVLAATNVDLEAAIAEGRFRDDLYFRLNGFSIRMPSLSERREDIADLMEHFAARICEREGIPARRFSPGAIRAAEEAEWSGNIRRLAREVEIAVLRAHRDGVLAIEQRHLFPEQAPAAPGGKPSRPTLQAQMRAYQARCVQEVLEEVDWDPEEAAERLDISRSHVYNLIKAHGLKRKG